MNSNTPSPDFSTTPDPFVDPRVCELGAKKSVEEILLGINGFRPVNPAPENGSACCSTDRDARESLPLIVINSASDSSKAPTKDSSSLRPSLRPKQRITLIPHGKPTLSYKSRSKKLSLNRSLQPVKAAKLINILDCETPEIDIRDLVIQIPVEERNLEPIRGSFDHDPEYFEHFAIQDRMEQTERFDRPLTQICTVSNAISDLPPAEATLPKSSNARPLDLIPAQTESAQRETAVEADVLREIGQMSDEMTEIIFAQDKQIIYVDGRDGFQYIDLSSFHLSQASFEANLIRIHTPQQDFEIDYRNVTHVVFAGNHEVELAAFER